MRKKIETTNEKLDRIIALLEQQVMRDRHLALPAIAMPPQMQPCHYHNGMPCYQNPCVWSLHASPNNMQ